MELYLVRLIDSLFRQTTVTPSMIEEFVELAEYDYPVVCRTIGAEISEYESILKSGDVDR